MSESELADFSGVLRRFVWNRLADWDAAEDIAQETLSRAVKALRGGKVRETEAIRGWLLRTAHHVCCHHIRSRQRERRALAKLDRHAVDDSAELLVARLIHQERLEKVRTVVAALERNDRAILTEASRSSTARVRKHRLVRALRQRLGDR